MRLLSIFLLALTGACVTPTPADPDDTGFPQVTVRLIERLEDGRTNAIVASRPGGNTDSERFGCRYHGDRLDYRDVSNNLISGTILPRDYFSEGILSDVRGPEFAYLNDGAVETRFSIEATDAGGIASIEATYVVGYSTNTGQEWLPRAELTVVAPAEFTTKETVFRLSPDSSDPVILELVETVRADFTSRPLSRFNGLIITLDEWRHPLLRVKVTDGGGRETATNVRILPRPFCGNVR